ncbi:MoaD/ThiS family protein [Desulfonatronovibrio magnus]|uniref:MoaD/ThiS family protein n=1 Tax=Desulfonatronovibrio magnus TaxID=698827 RepID=UPI0005EB21DF|nr:MoaD/ThiS family protein [Desulfonatronovibrio magnus]
MASICFRAFSFLQAELDKLGVKALDECMAIEENETVDHLLTRLGIDKSLVEAAFINGRVQPLNIPLQDNDRVALIPPGTPGPYRVLLGIRDNKSDRKE